MDVSLGFSLLLPLAGLVVIYKGLAIVRATEKVDAATAIVPKEEQMKAARRGALPFYILGGILLLAPLALWWLR